MATIRDRLAALERTSNNAPWLIIDVTDRPSPEQAEQIAQAERTGRMCIVFVARGDTAWIAGAGVPPWEQEGSDYHGDH